jgi:hypothetical protein
MQVSVYSAGLAALLGAVRATLTVEHWWTALVNVDNTRSRREPQRSVFGNKQTFAGSHSVVCLQPQNCCGRRGERL